jgi:protease-4
METQPPLIIPPAAPTPRRGGWVLYAIIATFFLFVSIMANFALLALLAGETVVPFEQPQRRFEEAYIQGDTDTRYKIAVIYLSGIIAGANDGEMSEEGMVGDLKAQLDQASDAIYQALAEAREYKPIVASMESVGASGAYYAAMGASHVMATDLTITGSIGVIMQSFTFGGLMDKVGLKSHTFKSGKYKDLLNPTREPTDEEKEMVKSLIMEVYDKFVGIVAKERELDLKQLKETLADGRILSGNQALKGKLIDEIGYFDDAVDKAMELAKIKKARVVTYQAPFSLNRLFRFFGESKSAKIQVQVGPTLPKLESGKLYFLPSYMFQ